MDGRTVNRLMRCSIPSMYSLVLTNEAALALVSSLNPTALHICSVLEEENSRGMGLEVLYLLDGVHDMSITCIDWGRSGRIITCGEDCRAIVWEKNGDKGLPSWSSTRVLFQQFGNSFTPLYCKWDDLGQKFALAMGGGPGSASLQVCSWDSNSNQ